MNIGQIAQNVHLFIVPIDCIELAIQLLIKGEIVHYRYDGDTEQVVERE